MVKCLPEFEYFYCGFVFSSKSISVKFPKRYGSTEVINGYKRFGFPNWRGGGKIEGRHISIIAMSEHHVDYLNRKGGHSVIMQGGSFHRFVHQIAWTREWRQGSGKL